MTPEDPFGFKATSAKSRAYAALRGLEDGYWYARWDPDGEWDVVELVMESIEGIEPYLEVWVIGRECAYDLWDYEFLKPVPRPEEVA